ncbi:Non-reducing end alpha-L-arabinofuranosidase BoGH43A [Podospora aff. communis PSN243]|uniref:Non-reducing end alpha-L-arabinofuranosidase BoGH43A n=1 Tax=Podospora aff. communis PSN243 TaxID=3040156 RepID=A0AAV9GB21_9PEZI|nr:Non-reducing end alpha-L-arabinofuranosidase BoGH43A [Podospora aff. communis PSN243]
MRNPLHFLLPLLLPFLPLLPLSLAVNSTFTNPILPGWHSDPSCIYHAPSLTFFCAVSTFIAFPGLPIYASQDLINWKLISHVWNRESQIPGLSWGTPGQQDGMYAPTLRYHDGEFWVVCEWIGGGGGGQVLTGLKGVLFRSKDPYEENGWGDALIFDVDKIDPDLFWDDDGKLYVATQGVILQELDLEKGELSVPAVPLWNGTGGVWPEGPHIYKKDGWYYLMIAEGGTALNHAITIARARSVKGPYEAYTGGNPILTNRRTGEWFQTVGHGDLFQDGKGKWWGMCLATRGGPEWKVFPMGREAVLFPVTWEEGEWPVLEPVRGRMSGWELPAPSRNISRGSGPWIREPDVYDFSVAGEPIPGNLMYWRVPREGVVTTTAKGLQMIPSRNNVTGVVTPASPNLELSGQRGMAFIGRRQTDTLFDFSVDLVGFRPSGVGSVGSEAGITVFLTQLNHIDLGVVLLPDPNGTSTLSLRFRTEVPPSMAQQRPAEKVIAIPAAWENETIRLQVSTLNTTHYELSASIANSPTSKIVVGSAWAGLVSGGTGPFTGVLVGVYATCNGAGSGLNCPNGGDKAFWQRWRYTGRGQEVAAGVVV